jgi:hypothetical protein
VVSGDPSFKVTGRLTADDSPTECRPSRAPLCPAPDEAITICPDPHTLAWISIHRAMSKPPFADDELELLARLGTHAERACAAASA